MITSAKILLEKGASLKSSGEKKQTALHKAANVGIFELVKERAAAAVAAAAVAAAAVAIFDSAAAVAVASLDSAAAAVPVPFW